MSSDRKSEIKSAYKSLGKAHGFYDGMMTGSNAVGRFMDKAVWNMTHDEVLEYQSEAFAAIPKDFNGKLLEVPVGTGVLSMPVFKTLPNADITCLDYSEKMMESAQSRANEMQIKNITFLQGDVGQLPFENEYFDAVVSLNGFHAFPDKEAAFSETCRVLKKGGIFCGCFYVEKANAHTDKIIKSIYVKKGFFTPPFETVYSLKERLETMYSRVTVGNVKSIAYFRCVK
ncbi:MAG: class I SAM-dependent methyltransferase [Ruminococcaceae bacterium]|nr:class I SAM-dependent methyltransferase [Oscillospiraceae bacterium]